MGNLRAFPNLNPVMSLRLSLHGFVTLLDKYCPVLRSSLIVESHCDYGPESSSFALKSTDILECSMLWRIHSKYINNCQKFCQYYV